LAHECKGKLKHSPSSKVGKTPVWLALSKGSTGNCESAYISLDFLQADPNGTSRTTGMRRLSQIRRRPI